MISKTTQTKVAFVVGTRPEAIKLSPLVETFRESAVVILTGQHEDWFVDVGRHFRAVDVIRTQPAARSWQILEDPTLPDDSIRLLEIIPQVGQMADALALVSPKHVVVQGDTRSALVGAIAARALQIPVSHVEAGLRSGSLVDPNPEEIYRRLITQVATYHYAPTEENRENLLVDGVDDGRIFVVGNTVVDGLESVAEDIRTFTPDRERPYVVITLHRNLSKRIRQKQLGAIGCLARDVPHLDFLFILHPNPVVKEHVEQFTEESECNNLALLPPQSRIPFLSLLKHAEFVISDSGGVQEEAPYFGKRVLIMRDYTERPEALGPLGNVLVGSDGSALRAAFRDQNLSSSPNFGEPYPFGDGQSSRRIYRTMRHHL